MLPAVRAGLALLFGLAFSTEPPCCSCRRRRRPTTRGRYRRGERRLHGRWLRRGRRGDRYRGDRPVRSWKRFRSERQAPRWRSRPPLRFGSIDAWVNNGASFQGGRRDPRLPPFVDELHVLLRQRLLRQPHGFEGFPRIEIVTPTGDLSVPQLEEPAPLSANLRSGRLCSGLVVGEDDDGVTHISKPGLLELAQVGEPFEHVGGEATQLGVTTVGPRASLECSDWLACPLRVRAPAFQPALDVAVVPPLDHPPHALDVLLRHRLL